MRSPSFIFLCLTAAASLARADTYSGYQSNNADKIYYFEVSDLHIARTPKWVPNGAEPPLRVGRAIILAKSLLPRMVPNPKSWKVGIIRIHRVEKSDNWIYMVELVGPPYQNPGDFSPKAPAIDVPVLMDGTVTLPRISRTR
jgi:hypothetical protein